MRNKSFCLFTALVVLLAGILINISSVSGSNSLSPISPREEATVQIGFDGLMALCFGNPERVSAGLLDAHHHALAVDIADLQVRGTRPAELAEGRRETEVASQGPTPDEALSNLREALRFHYAPLPTTARPGKP